MNRSQFRRGFKAEAERLSLELRTELGLSPTDRLDPFILAEHLAIPIKGLRTLRTAGVSADAINHFGHRARDVLSAMTLVKGSRRLIVVNDAHAATRQASSLAHELSHVVLEHEPHRLLIQNGCRVWNDEMEKEADWLGGTILVPREAALLMARGGVSITEAAARYGVSEVMMSWRIQHTGAAIQARRGGVRS